MTDDNGTPAEAPKLTPTQRLHEVTLAALTRTQRGTSLETVSVKHATTGTQAGHLVIDDLTVPKHEGENDEQWIQRFGKMLRQVHLVVTQENVEAYRLQAEVVQGAKGKK